MKNILKHKKRVTVICIIALIFIGTATFITCSGLKESGSESVTPPENTDDGMSVKPTDKTVADYLDNPNLNLYIANSVLTEAGSFRSVSRGTSVSTKIGFSITQDIYAMRIVKGDTVYKQSASYGIVKTGDERVVHGDTYLYRSAAELNSVTEMNWSDDTPNSLTRDEFFNRYGYRGNGLTGYILNDETIVSSTFDGRDENTGLYSFTYDLDNEKATARMLYEMRTNSGSSNFATYEKAILHVTMDENWVIHTISTDCAYNVPLFGSTPCKENLTEEFTDIGLIDDYAQFPHYDYYSRYIDFTATPPVDDDNVNPSPLPAKPTQPAEPQPTDVLMSMFESYLSGSPLNAALQTKIGGYDISADITLKLDVEHPENIVLSAVTDNGIRLTYANGKIFAAINDVKLRASVADIPAALQQLGTEIRIPEFDLSLLGQNLANVMSAITLERTETTATVRVPVSFENVDIELIVNGKKTDENSYAFTDATVTVNGVTIYIKSQEKTIEPLDMSDDSFADVCAIIEDYSDVVNSVIELKSSIENKTLSEKSLTLEIQPLKLHIDGKTYETQNMTLRLYASPSRIVITGDKLDLTCTTADNTVTKKQISFGGAFVLPTEDAEGRLYLTINDLVNPDSDLKISIGSKALVDCLKKRLPELTDAIPQLKELLKIKIDKENIFDYISMLSALGYDRENDKTLSLTVNAETLLKGAGNLNISLSRPDDDTLSLSVSKPEGSSLTDNISLILRKDTRTPSQEEIDGAYDIGAEHINFDSADTLLLNLINTARRKSFRLTGKIPVNLNALSIVKADVELGVDVKIDVEKDETGKDVVYIAAKISRGELSGVTKMAFADKGGDSYLFYNGKEGLITIKRNSLNEAKWCGKCNGFECSSSFLHTAYRKNKTISDMDYRGKCGYEETVTEKQFADDVLGYVLKMINFTQTINNAIVDATSADDKNKFGIDDVFVGYSYAAPAFNVKLDLKPIDSVLGRANVYIEHGDDFTFTSLHGDITLLDISGVSAKGTFEIALTDSVDGEAKSLTADATLF